MLSRRGVHERIAITTTGHYHRTLDTAEEAVVEEALPEVVATAR
ncbi:hypothetical protein BJY24_005662 [Nocardia transvalensis]|uniref:Uncharacterized protein n=1 Tax=Nocardia transvalensis TaxID=37333 RepID=A0A7W9PIY4_9NOCA|nr:hypothetical protein [Nocardia transvalensis]MBB5916750.1 hypothetical protein [Nocardia transvalensis]